MTNQQTYLQNRMRLGWGLMILGGLLIATGLVLQFVITVPWNARLVSGLGILIAALGIGQIVRSRAMRGDRKMAARIINEERDERSTMIRARAGNRGFWVSLAMTYAALMWLSFSANGSLPAPSPDTLWFYLAAAVVIPFGVYVVSLVYDQNNR